MEITGLPNSDAVGFQNVNDGSTEAASNSLAGDFDTFLALLTTQLQNQDPLDPLDANQFTEQLVQFAGVEQAINTNKKLDQLVALQSANQLNAAVAYIGNEVKVSSDRFALQDGGTNLEYTLSRDAQEAVLTIVNEAGLPVRTVNGETGIGTHQYAWDGRDNNGAQLPDGVYSFFLTAADGTGETVQATTAIFGQVTGVEVGDDGLMLGLGALDVSLEDVLAVREPTSEI